MEPVDLLMCNMDYSEAKVIDEAGKLESHEIVRLAIFTVCSIRWAKAHCKGLLLNSALKDGAI